MLYLGTSISAGHAIALVTATGAHTELGRIGKLVTSAKDETPPLKHKLTVDEKFAPAWVPDTYRVVDTVPEILPACRDMLGASITELL